MTQKNKAGKPSFLELEFTRFIYVNDIQARIEMARRGLGVVGCIHETMKHEVERGEMVALSPKKLSVPLQVQIASPHKNPSPFVVDFASQLAAWIAEC